MAPILHFSPSLAQVLSLLSQHAVVMPSKPLPKRARQSQTSSLVNLGIPFYKVAYVDLIANTRRNSGQDRLDLLTVWVGSMKNVYL